MAQVDKVSYLPLLFWCLVFFFIIYISVGFFYMPKTFATISIRVAFFKKMCRRFAKYYRQFKFNLRCLGAVEIAELSLSANALLLAIYRLPFLK